MLEKGKRRIIKQKCSVFAFNVFGYFFVKGTPKKENNNGVTKGNYF